MPSIVKKRLLREKYKKLPLSSFHNTILTQTSRSAFAGTIEQFKITKFGLELIEIVYCFLYGHVMFPGTSVSLK